MFPVSVCLAGLFNTVPPFENKANSFQGTYVCSMQTSCLTFAFMVTISSLFTKHLQQSHVRYLTRITYLFPQTRHIGFPQVTARQSAGARAAIRGSPAQQCTDCPQMNVEAYVLD